MGKEIVWTKCKGLPLSFWNEEYFSKSVAIIGTLVEADETTKIWD